MKLEGALPGIFRRPFPVVEEGTAMLVAGTLLDTPRRDVLPIIRIQADKGTMSLTKRGSRHLAFSGYSLVARLLATRPEDRYRFLFEPCERALASFPLLEAGGLELSEVLDGFARERFGWAFVARGAAMRAVVTLADLVPLYQKGFLWTELTVGDVASPMVFSLPRTAKVDEALRGMMKRRVRRVFLTGTGSFVSDREILTYLFSPERLSVVRRYPRRMLDPALEEVERVEPVEVDGRAAIGEASGLFKAASGAWCAVCSEGVVTPWDLVMKPWKAGRLAFGEAAQVQRPRGGPAK
jgi:hypothetical protein